MTRACMALGFVLLLVDAHPAAAIEPFEQAYQKARKSYYQLKGDAARQRFRHNWQKAAALFERVAERYPQSARADDALFTAGRLYHDLYVISRLQEDLDRSRGLFTQLVGKHADSHLADDAFWQALDAFQGPVLASHNNCRALVPGDRQFSDEQVRAIAARGGVIGVALDAWMLDPGWVKGETSNTVVSLDAVAEQIDHICQVAGNARHAGVGSDLDGGYGTEQCPYDLDTIADLQKIPDLLRGRGYDQADIEAIMHGNWMRFFQQAWSG